MMHRATPRTLRILGIDLAWGERMPDGVCALVVNSRAARVLDLGLVRGDAALLDWIRTQSGTGAALLALDGPVICRNLTGTRPVDRLTHVHFGRYKAGCHPVNLTRCARPPRVAEAAQALGFKIGWDFALARRLITEVYPHPAMVRLFDLPERIRYKKGPVAERRIEFRRLQRLLIECLRVHFPKFQMDTASRALLREGWTKPIEDRTDALVCALIGYWHWLHCGTQTQVLGDLASGFLLVPQPKE